MKRLAMLSIVIVVLAGVISIGVVGCSSSKSAAPVAAAKDGQQAPVEPQPKVQPQQQPMLLERLRQNEAINQQQPAQQVQAAPQEAQDDRERFKSPATTPEATQQPTVQANPSVALAPPGAGEPANAEALDKRGGGNLAIDGNVIESLEELSRQSQEPQAQQQQGRGLAAAGAAPSAGGGRGRGGGGGGRGGRGGAGGGGGGAPGGFGGNPANRAGGGGGGGGGRGVPFVAIGPNARGPARIIWPTSNEEVWIIVRPNRPQFVLAAPVNDAFPRTGTLIARLPDRPTEVAVPLKHTDVKATISGYVATVEVTQQFQNPFSTKIEAVYVFPLPDNAAVNEFVMTVGDRKIRGIIRERQEAEQIYAAARAQGYVASLLTQERPNIFTQKVANIEPSKEIDINIKYYHTLEYVDGWYTWHFPMVVGPRFNPSGWTDGVGAVPVGGSGTSGQSTEVQYLRPEQRNGHDISLAVQVSAGVPIEQIETPNHRVTTSVLGNEISNASVKLSSGDSIPNKDFVLRYKVAGQTLKSAVMVQRDPGGQGGYFALMLIPPETMKSLPRQPLEMVFTLDVSGSMNGKPFSQARSAVEYALTHMNPTDTFQVVRFATGTEVMTPTAVPATPENVRAGVAYVQQMTSGGGTNMLEGIKASLQLPRDEEHTRYVAFLTDGFIGNEVQILREIHQSLADSRIFSFGVGNSVNRYLLDHMAKMGAGAVTYLGLDDDAKETMAMYFERISHPALSDIKVDYGTMTTTDVFPAKVPDLFVGRPVILTGRFTGRGTTTVHVTGRIGGETRSFDIPINLDDSANQHPGITSVWARMKIASLADQSAWDDAQDFSNPIKQLAIDYGLMSQFTAFVAVDSSSRTAGGPAATVGVPVPVPDGVRYDTTVPEGGRIVQPGVVVPRD